MGCVEVHSFSPTDDGTNPSDSAAAFALIQWTGASTIEGWDKQLFSGQSGPRWSHQNFLRFDSGRPPGRNSFQNDQCVGGGFAGA